MHFSVVFKNATPHPAEVELARRRRGPVAGDCALGTDEWANFLNYGTIGTIALFPRTPAARGKLLNLISKCPARCNACRHLPRRRVPCRGTSYIGYTSSLVGICHLIYHLHNNTYLLTTLLVFIVTPNAFAFESSCRTYVM